jgi:hypothetical protein
MTQGCAAQPPHVHVNFGETDGVLKLLAGNKYIFIFGMLICYHMLFKIS